MSEYQYFEFQAIDRPLSKKEMAELRSYSTRARITPTSFVNDYSWGDFKGDADVWMDKYFDAFLYLANWGTRILKLRLPDRLLNAKTARLYAVGEHTAARVRNGNVIISFHSENEDVEDSVESEGSLASLISVRSELAHGDLRALYLGWLLCVQNGELDPDSLSPPVPAGLTKPPIRPHGTASIGDTKSARAPARCWMSVAMSANNVSRRSKSGRSFHARARTRSWGGQLHRAQADCRGQMAL